LILTNSDDKVFLKEVYKAKSVIESPVIAL